MLGGLAGTEGQGKMLALACVLAGSSNSRLWESKLQTLSHNLWRDLSGRSSSTSKFQRSRAPQQKHEQGFRPSVLIAHLNACVRRANVFL